MCPFPQLRLVGVRTSYIYMFLIFPGHIEFWTPLQIPRGALLLAAPSFTVSSSSKLIEPKKEVVQTSDLSEAQVITRTFD